MQNKAYYHDNMEVNTFVLSQYRDHALLCLSVATNVFAAVPQFGSNADRYVNIPEDTPIGK